MQMSVRVLALIGLVCAEVKMYAPEIAATETLADTAIDVDENAEVQMHQRMDPMTKGGAQLMLLAMFDKNNDQCVDQAEYANLIVLNPLAALGQPEGNAAWALAALQKGRIDAKAVAPFKWCPTKHKKILNAAAGDEVTVEGEDPEDIEELDDEEEFENPHIDKNITKGCKKGARESHYMQESCKALVNKTVGDFPIVGKKLAKPAMKMVGKMCRSLFPGPCVVKPKQVVQLAKPAFASMEAVSKSGWRTAKLSEEEWAKGWDAEKKVYSPEGLPASPQDAFHHPDLHCGKKWAGEYWEKNVSIGSMKLIDLIPGTPNYSPLGLFFLLRSLINDGSITALKSNQKLDSPVEVAIYAATEATTGIAEGGVCVVAWQETQDEKGRGNSDWRMNMAADLINFPDAKGKAHRGLLRAYETLESTIKDYFLSSVCGDSSKIKKIIFTGYSAGGGMAVMNFVHAKKTWGLEERGQQAFLITAGAPPVGDIEFCEENFGDGKAYQVASFDDAIVTGRIAGDLGVIVMGLLQIHHCSKLHWISCPDGLSDCHSQDKVYSAWAMNYTSGDVCGTLVGDGEDTQA